ncbi:MAG: type I-E CRISPR-associated protein Cas5/CasD [Rothia sp. (in: high G+C Gram-positive bacteria)]|nr:type I-E CRISPR-associated protein Cas5/CasD [Rothia sp. (in: high G+C Gram-positive bacteria)]
MTDSVYIRLAGPLQSWAGASVTGNIVRTESLPTPSSLRGLLAGALGYKRGDLPEWLQGVEFTVREEKRVTFTDDFQTINPRTGEEKFRRRMLLAQGMKASSAKNLIFTPDAQGGTSIVNRTYLADSEFIVRITAEGYTEQIDAALRSPRFSTYLGRKAFPAVFPFYLGVGNSELIHQLPVLTQNKGEEHRKVIVHSFVQNQPLAPSIQVVPTVENREAWLNVVANLLKRRKTFMTTST